ncbi:hypothetical protein A1Q1_01734 [Trichosporon asahii var. asahii CBS 2479]|uniref:Uncharacterized protein n=1 Tax=Trichosporon asahii var. asahii (strain ATCC 90039 / CBS 2479 / JCM 2466 / KCTC 7840 / NBRC 103889/ NCYC 2677 / UAMH 7654) TaxID=1186058 RepID=J4UDA7_TRIAS|nr:hypothetical protein A1Q1_01734 [Trichosporon asahii var. asahii CBS 2479]EJT49085.1 hypothetical protein A1Q1_01734 [Trichosporon asahii var. asahii CBS 2479]
MALRAAIKRAVEKFKLRFGRAKDGGYERIGLNDDQSSATSHRSSAQARSSVDIGDVFGSAPPVSTSVTDGDHDLQSPINPTSAPVSSGPRSAHSASAHSHDEKGNQSSDSSTVTETRQATIHLPSYRRQYTSQPTPSVPQEHQKLRKLPVRKDTIAKSLMKEKLSLLTEEIRGAVLDATPSSMLAEVQVELRTKAWTQVLLESAPVDPESRPLCLIQTLSTNEEEFLPDSDIHNLIDSTLKELGDAMVDAARRQYGSKLYITIKAILHITASVQVLVEDDAETTQLAGSMSAYPVREWAVSVASHASHDAHEALGLSRFEDLVSELHPLTKSKLLRDLVFVVYGGYTWTNSTRTIWFKSIDRHPFSYARILSPGYDCPRGVDAPLHWTHSPDDAACPCVDREAETVYAIRPWCVNEDGGFDDSFNPDRDAVRVGPLKDFMPAFAALPE